MKATNPKDLIGSDKLPLHLFPTSAKAYGVLGLLDGMLKYGRSNWRAVGIRASIYYDAVGRHLDAWFEGEDDAPDSGLPHLAHAIAGIAIIIDATVKGNMTDDRLYPGNYRHMMENLQPHIARLKESHADKSPYHYTIEQLGDGDQDLNYATTGGGPSDSEPCEECGDTGEDDILFTPEQLEELFLRGNPEAKPPEDVLNGQEITAAWLDDEVPFGPELVAEIEKKFNRRVGEEEIHQDSEGELYTMPPTGDKTVPAHLLYARDWIIAGLRAALKQVKEQLEEAKETISYQEIELSEADEDRYIDPLVNVEPPLDPAMFSKVEGGLLVNPHYAEFLLKELASVEVVTPLNYVNVEFPSGDGGYFVPLEFAKEMVTNGIAVVVDGAYELREVAEVTSLKADLANAEVELDHKRETIKYLEEAILTAVGFEQLREAAAEIRQLELDKTALLAGAER